MTYYVSLYLIDRAYGGPEEGGWWYTYGIPQASEHNRKFALEAEAIAYAATLDPILAELNEGRPDINSVISEGRYEFLIDEGAPAPFPETRPHYE